MLRSFKNTMNHELNQISPNQGIKIMDSKFILLPNILGQGKFSVVYQGKNIDTHQRVAIKICQSSSKLRKQMLILEEIYDQPNSIKMFGCYRFFQKYAVVLEYFQENLRSFINKQRNIGQIFLYNLTLKVVDQILMLKKCKILHRDIKPQNILLRNNQLKISDFSQSVQFQTDARKFMDKNIGTIYYMAPQVIQFGQYSQKSDVWSLGILLYQLFTGHYPLKLKEYCQRQKLYEKLMNNVEEIGLICSKCLNLSAQKRITMQQLKRLLVEKIQKTEQEIQQKKQCINVILKEMISRIKLQKLNINIVNNMVLECQRLMNVNIVKKQQLGGVLKQIKKLKPIIQYSNTNNLINLNINQFMLFDTVLILLNYLSLNKIKILQDHIVYDGKKKSLQYYKQIKDKIRCL